MSEKKRDLIWLLIVLVVLIGIIPALMPWGGYMAGMMGMMGYGWGFMFLVPLTLLVLIGLGAYYFITESTRTGRSTSRPSQRAPGRCIKISEGDD